MSATLVRYVFGLPVAVAYLWALTGSELPMHVSAALSQSSFLIPALLAGVFQIIATVLLILVFRYRNFMVGTSVAKTESIQTALFGTLFFAVPLSLGGWVAIVLGVVGVWLMALPKPDEPWDARSISMGLASGACFGLTSLWIRQASLGLNLDSVISAAITLMLVVAFQSVVCISYTAVATPGEFAKIWQRWPLAVMVGATSALGSIGWFTAMTMQNPALVKSLGQVEMLFTAVLTLRFFRERVRTVEWVGVMVLVTSIVILLNLA